MTCCGKGRSARQTKACGGPGEGSILDKITRERGKGDPKKGEGLDSPNPPLMPIAIAKKVAFLSEGTYDLRIKHREPAIILELRVGSDDQRMD